MATIISGIGYTLRTGAKELIRGGLVVTTAVSEFAANTGNQFKSLVTEARSELKQARASELTRTGASGISDAPTERTRLWNRVTSAGHTAWDAAAGAATSLTSKANEEIAVLVAWFTGESKEKAEEQVTHAEQEIRKDEKRVAHFARGVGRDLAKEESAAVIETVLTLAA